MNLEPLQQIQLFGHNKIFDELKNYTDNDKLPTKILFNGKKGIGKFTLTNHLVNYVLSLNEDHKYDIEKLKINVNNKSYKLVINQSSPNYFLITIKDGKKNIEIDQIRELVNFCNKSSFNDKPRFVIIDNVERLNLNSSNALLKILEEPNKGIHFILINNSAKILPTIKSRCISFNINLSFENTKKIFLELTNQDLDDLLSSDIICPYFSVGDYLAIYQFLKINDIDLSKIELKKFLKIVIEEKIYKKDNLLGKLIYDLIELYYIRSNKLPYNFHKFELHINSVNNMFKFNLDTETIFLKLHQQLN